MTSLLDRYILREWLALLALVVAACLGLLLMQAMYDELRDLLDVGATLVDIAFYFAVALPSYFSVVLPLAMLLSLLYTLGRLHRNLEITAFRAAGVGVFRITRSIWAAGLVLCAVTAYFNASVIPWSVEEARSVLQGLRFRTEAQSARADRVGATSTVAFDNQRENRMWLVNRYSRYTGRAYGVAISELTPERREKTRWQAREGWFDAAAGHWVLKDGRETWLDPETQEVTRSVPFKQQAIPALQERPELMLAFGAKPSELSLFELRRVIEYYEADANPKVTLYAVRYFGLLADTFAPLIIIALAVPFAISGVRVNPAVGVSKSIGLFVLYYILVRGSIALGAREVIEPLWAAVLPNAVMGLLGLWLLARLR